MKAIIYYSLSGKTDRKVHELFEGDFYRLEGKIKIPKMYWLQIVYLGFFASLGFKLKYKPLDIDFDQYDEIVLASPVWAFTISPFLKKYLRSHRFKNKKVTLLVTHQGGQGNVFKHFKKFIHRSNDIVDELAYQFGSRYDKSIGQLKK